MIATVEDRTGPTVEITSPPEGTNYTLIDGGVTVEVVGTAIDTQTGVDVVEWDLDAQNKPEKAFPRAPGDWSTWSASVSLSTPGDHTIAVRATDKSGKAVRATDKSGNVSFRTLTVHVLLAFEAVDPLDIVSSVAYLHDLLEFTKHRVLTGPEDTSADPQKLTDTFFQPFAALTEPGIRSAAVQSVHQVRLCIEVLREYLVTHNLTLSDEIEKIHRETAYHALLNHLGASYEELRIAKVADIEYRSAIARRLGFILDPQRPDQLDHLLLQSDQITEADLERLFGLADTTRDSLPIPVATVPELFVWRKLRLHATWRDQDDLPRAEVGTQVPVIDPDLVFESDVRDPVKGNVALDILIARRKWVLNRLEEIKSKREEQGSDLDGFDAIVSDIIGSGSDLIELAEKHAAGNNIQQELHDKQLGLRPFLFLMRVRELAHSGTNTVTDAEWDDVYAILVQVKKFREFENWRAEERQQNLILGPDFFTLADNQTVFELLEEVLPWRATENGRQAWEDILVSRINQEIAVSQSLDSAVSAVEEVVLPPLRDALIGAIEADADPNTLANRLTHELAVDMHASGNQQTTRVHQAIETLQSILFSLRTQRFEAMEPVLGTNPVVDWTLDIRDEGENTYTESDFDQEWEWMGAYDTWRAAILVFGYPENYLQPSLREQRSPEEEQADEDLLKYPTGAFWNLVKRLRNNQRLTPSRARLEAQKYLNELVFIEKENGTKIKTAIGEKMTPGLTEPLVRITEQFSNAQLQERRFFVKKFFEDDNGAALFKEHQNVPNYLQEIFYFVPILIAKELQKARQYLAAMDWFQTIYAYNLSENSRIIYPGLELAEEKKPIFVRNLDDWLLGGLNPHGIANERPHAYLRFTLMSLVQCFLAFADSEFTQDSFESIPRARSLYVTALELLDLPEMQRGDTDSIIDPFPPNPVLQALRMHAELNLFKLRSGRNIAGMEREAVSVAKEPEPISALMPAVNQAGQLSISRATAFRPTPYRYSVLIERTKQLVGIAQQIEASFLATLEKADAENYNLMKAEQDLGLAGARIRLQELRVSEAKAGVVLAIRQRARARIQADHFQGLLREGLIGPESSALNYMKDSLYLQLGAAAVHGVQTVHDTLKAVVTFSVFGDPAGHLAQTLSSLAGAASTHASRLQTIASYERRTQEWRFQHDLARQDILIGSQHYLIANKHESVVRQEKSIADMQKKHAQETVNFLANKFTNADLYEWMSDILGSVYSYFLQQATALAQLAQYQLSFERQETQPSFIQTDYWQIPAGDQATIDKDEETSDRKGLTGSARLLQDIYRLDQYAFETNQRKLQLSQSFSLARLAPIEFQRFRETGVMTFATPMELFDQSFPGHYLRLIKRVRVSVIALVPPTQGIRASLSNTGISRVVIGGNTFQTIVVRRDPEMVAFTSPINATGLFELQTEGEMLLPFESMGVDSSWELQMPRAANSFEYNTVADVLITIDYTALHSFTYRQQVIQGLDRRFSADRPFSFRQEFADQWYYLNNPPGSDDTESTTTITFETRRGDFPPNIDELRIKHLVMFLVRSDGEEVEVPIVNLLLTIDEGEEIPGGPATSSDGVISTRRGNAPGWTDMAGNQPFGKWELTFPNSTETRQLFEDEIIEDILFVITYEATTPEWPG